MTETQKPIRWEDDGLFDENFAFGQQFEPAVIEIVGRVWTSNVARSTAGKTVDKCNAIDGEGGPTRWSQRVRRWPKRIRDHPLLMRPENDGRIEYGRHFTITCWKSGMFASYRSEYQKMIERRTGEPAPNWLIYGYGNPQTLVVAPYCVVDLGNKDVRAWIAANHKPHTGLPHAKAQPWETDLPCGCFGHNDGQQYGTKNYCGYWSFNFFKLALDVPGSILRARHTRWSDALLQPLPELLPAASLKNMEMDHSPGRASEWLRWSKLWDEGGRDPLFLADPDAYATERGWR